MAARISLMIGLALLAAPAHAEDLASKRNDELCVSLAMSMIQGDRAAKDELQPVLVQRGESCAPSDMYIKIAESRLRLQQAGQNQAALDEVAEQQRRSDRDARIRAAGQAWLIHQAQQDAQRRANFPKTTTCRSFANTTTCDTR